MDTGMRTTNLLELDIERSIALVADGAAFIDLRPSDAYLEVHIPGSLNLLYEFGPGMAGRARDCLPLDLPLILMSSPGADMGNAAAALRGKGFTVVGSVEDAINGWAAHSGTPSSTEVLEGPSAPEGVILDLSDPGVIPPDDARRIPLELLWARAGELAGEARVVVAAGYGVRAALGVGMLERAGVEEVIFWKTRSKPRRRYEAYG
jgi:rhodanese-related sulfurtransferase